MRIALAAAGICLLALTGCGGTDSDSTEAASTPSSSESAPSPSEEPAGEPTDDGGDDADDGPSEDPPEETPDDAEDGGFEIEVAGDRIEPNGERVEVEAGDPIRLAVESDRAGEFHVHSSPEQVKSFKAGDSVVMLTVERPGIVDVEEHETGVVVLQLEVR